VLSDAEANLFAGVPLQRHTGFLRPTHAKFIYFMNRVKNYSHRDAKLRSRPTQPVLGNTKGNRSAGKPRAARNRLIRLEMRTFSTRAA
jgi:hypothetical protein